MNLFSRPALLLLSTGLALAVPTVLIVGAHGPAPVALRHPASVTGPALTEERTTRPAPEAAFPAPAASVPTAARPVAVATPAPPPPRVPRATPQPPVATARPVPPPSTLPAFSHIFTIVMENKESTSIMGNPSAPYINGLAARYGLATNYFGVSHPSLPNYLALTAGSTFGIRSDCTTCYVNAPNIADQVEASGRTWRAYMEDMPAPCFTGGWSGSYAMKHDPFMYYDDIRTNPARCAAHVVPFTQFSSDVGSGRTPNYVFITPNMCHDMHDCPVSTGDSWLAGVVPTITSSPAFLNGGVLFITWDEGASAAGCCADSWGGRVATLVISPHAIPGYRSAIAENHYSLLRTIEDAWHLGHLGAAGYAATGAMGEYFRN